MKSGDLGVPNWEFRGWMRDFGVQCGDFGVLCGFLGSNVRILAFYGGFLGPPFMILGFQGWNFGVPWGDFLRSLSQIFGVPELNFWDSRGEFGGILGFWGAHQVLEDEREAALRVNDVVQCHDVGVLQVLQQRHCGEKS